MLKQALVASSIIVALFSIAEDSSAQFDSSLGVGVYLTGMRGDYDGMGAGGRLRWQPFELLGFDTFAEFAMVDSELGRRTDIPVGFNAYIPLPLGLGILQFRPFAGFCAVISRIDPESDYDGVTDDIMFGFHVGLGVDIAVASVITVFGEVKGTGYLGRDREGQWLEGGKDDLLSAFGTVQGSIGVMLHLP